MADYNVNVNDSIVTREREHPIRFDRFYQKENNATTTITDNPFAQSATTLNVTDGSVFPSRGDFLLTLWNKSSFARPGADSGMEIVKCTSRSGNVLTVVRAQESTSDTAHTQGEHAELLITKASLTEYETQLNACMRMADLERFIAKDYLKTNGSNADQDINIGTHRLSVGGLDIAGTVDWTGITGNIDIGSNNFVTSGTGSFDALTLTGDTSVIFSAHEIDIKPNGDADDYIRFSTTGDVPQITGKGANLKIMADGGTVDFVDNRIITTGSMVIDNDSGGFQAGKSQDFTFGYDGAKGIIDNLDTGLIQIGTGGTDNLGINAAPVAGTAFFVDSDQADPLKPQVGLSLDVDRTNGTGTSGARTTAFSMDVRLSGTHTAASALMNHNAMAASMIDDIDYDSATFGAISNLGLQFSNAFSGSFAGAAEFYTLYGIQGTASGNLGTAGTEKDKFGIRGQATGTGIKTWAGWFAGRDALTTVGVYSEVGMTGFLENTVNDGRCFEAYTKAESGTITAGYNFYGRAPQVGAGTYTTFNHIWLEDATAAGTNRGIVIDSDTISIHIGDDQIELVLGSDGTNGIIDCDAELRIGTDGGTTNYSAFEPDGTLEFNGAATVFDDLRTPVSQLRVPGSKAPTWTTYNGTQLLGFSYQAVEGNEEEVYLVVQIPHSYKEGSNIVPHIHWIPNEDTTDDPEVVRWGLECEWKNIDGTFSGTTTIHAEESMTDRADDHIKTAFSAIDGTGKTISSMLTCRLFRNSSSPNDTYDSGTALALLLEIDFHFEIDTVGSRTVNDSK